MTATMTNHEGEEEDEYKEDNQHKEDKAKLLRHDNAAIDRIVGENRVLYPRMQVRWRWGEGRDNKKDCFEKLYQCRGLAVVNESGRRFH